MDRLPPGLSDPVALFLDKFATPSSLFTATKTTDRRHYDAARARFGLPDAGGPANVLLWNAKGMITATSVRNFCRGRWVDSPRFDRLFAGRNASLASRTRLGCDR
jgi:hypothetical protein